MPKLPNATPLRKSSNSRHEQLPSLCPWFRLDLALPRRCCQRRRPSAQGPDAISADSHFSPHKSSTVALLEEPVASRLGQAGIPSHVGAHPRHSFGRSVFVPFTISPGRASFRLCSPRRLG